MTKPQSEQKIFLIGAGMHGQTCIDVIEKQAKYRIAGLIDSIKPIGSFIDGYEVLGRMGDLPKLMEEHNTQAGFIGIGDNGARKRISEEVFAHAPDFEFINAIHPGAVFGKNVTLGKGIFVGAGTFVSSSCVIGDFCLLHHKVLLGLHNDLGGFSSVSLGSLTGGKVSIGDLSAVTLRAVVKDRVTIGSNSVVGVGSVVLKDVPNSVVTYGHPAVVIRNRKTEDPYLESG